ncbi:hypothetical protein OSL44_24615, partial [Escherichia coli]|nr:hypothetical protein [Escherichia coli]
IVGKLLVGSYNIFIFPNGGWRILFLVWLVELVIVGLLLSNRSIQNTLKLQHAIAFAAGLSIYIEINARNHQRKKVIKK